MMNSEQMLNSIPSAPLAQNLFDLIKTPLKNMSNLRITNDTLFNFLEFLSMQDIYFETIEEKTEAIDKFLLSDFYYPPKIEKPKIKITLSEWHYKCGDGCCDHYGTDVKVNGNKINTNSEDTSEVLRAVFEHLGFDIEVKHEYDYE